MMNAKRTAIIGLGICMGVGTALAQTAPELPPLPSGPIPKKIEDVSAWQIDYTYGEAKEPKTPEATPPIQPVIQANSISVAPPRQITLTYTRPLWHAVINNIDQRKTEEWSDGKVQLFTSDGVSGPMRVPVDDSTHTPLIPDFNSSNFPDMQWISRETYTGTGNIEGHNCFIFKKQEMTAWIDMASLNPVQWQRGQEKRVFRQLPAPTGMLQMPPEMEKLDKAIQRQIQIQMTPYTSGG